MIADIYYVTVTNMNGRVLGDTDAAADVAVHSNTSKKFTAISL